MSHSSRSALARTALSPVGTHVASGFAALAVAILLLLPVPPGASDWLPDWLPGWLPGWLPVGLASRVDKLVHAGLFFVLTGFWLRSFERLGARSRPIASAVLAATAYGAVLEGVQALTPTRASSFGDAAANLCGALLLGVFAAFSRRFRRSSENR